MQNALQQLKQEWERNPRLQLGGWLIIGICFIYAWLTLAEYNEALVGEASSATAHINKLQTISSQPQWPDRAATALQIEQLHRQKLWHAENQGLAQAALQSWLQTLLRDQGFDTGLIKVQDALPVDGLESTWKVRAHIEGDSEQASVLDLLDKIERRDELIRIDTFKMSPERNRVFQITLVAYFIVAPGASA